MITVDVRGLDGISEMLKRGGKQTRFAAAVALTKTAKHVSTGLSQALSRALPGASPYTQRSSYSTSATKAGLTAKIGIKDKKPARGTAPATLLKEHFTGGRRGNKPMEKALMSLGMLPAGWRVVPGHGMPLDSHGNPRAKVVGEIIGALKSRMQIHKGRGKQVALVGYFAIGKDVTSPLAPGIYWRNGRAIKPMLLFIPTAGYRQVIDLPRLTQRIVGQRFALEFAAAYAAALSTAR